MEVYVEYVIIDNLIVNALLIMCMLKTLGLKAHALRVFVSSAFGTAAVCVFPFFKIPIAFEVVSKICVGVIMVLVSHNFKTIKHFVYGFLLFVLYTFLMGGACVGMIKLLGGNPESLGGGNYDTIVPVSLIILAVFVYAFIIFRLTKYIYRRKDMLPFMQKATLKIGDTCVSVNAYIDSGNRLYDKKTGAPIIILSAFALEKVFGKDDIASLVFGEKTRVFKDVHFVSYSTVEGVAKKMVVFVADSLTIESNVGAKTFENVCVGVTFKKFNDAINFEMLLHPSLMGI